MLDFNKLLLHLQSVSVQYKDGHNKKSLNVSCFAGQRLWHAMFCYEPERCCNVGVHCPICCCPIYKMTFNQSAQHITCFVL